MLTPIESLQHQINKCKQESQRLKDKHEWGMWNNWREFINLDLKIMDLEMELLEKEKQLLQQALEDYKDY